jgi:hypothetical protein
MTGRMGPDLGWLGLASRSRRCLTVSCVWLLALPVRCRALPDTTRASNRLRRPSWARQISPAAEAWMTASSLEEAFSLVISLLT